MAKQLQLILQDREYEEIRRTADAQGLPIAAWVRQALVAARRREPEGNWDEKLDAVPAARYSFHPADVDDMLAEFERTYGVSGR